MNHASHEHTLVQLNVSMIKVVILWGGGVIIFADTLDFDEYQMVYEKRVQKISQGRLAPNVVSSVCK